MRITYFIWPILMLGGCFYDPPLKGIEVVIENQTDQFVYVTDTLFNNSIIKLYDTASVNNKMYISAVPNYIPKYHKWIAFLSENQLRQWSREHKDKLSYYFISEKNLSIPGEDIINQHLYKVIHVDIADVLNNDINYIYYYTDSFSISHERDYEATR